VPTAHNSPADTKATSESSPPPADAPAPRLKEPHVPTSARPTPAPGTADATSRPGKVRAAVAAAPAATTDTTKPRRDTGAWPWSSGSRSCPSRPSLALSSTAPPKNAHNPGARPPHRGSPPRASRAWRRIGQGVPDPRPGHRNIVYAHDAETIGLLAKLPAHMARARQVLTREISLPVNNWR
jgi:hypothetical protein